MTSATPASANVQSTPVPRRGVHLGDEVDAVTSGDQRR
jgi:hypothetical protein